MTTDLRALITQMAAELDHCQQLLMDDRRQRHPLADRARTLLAEQEAEGPSALELEAIELALWDKYRTKGWGGEEFMYDNDFSYALEEYRAALDRWGHHPAPPAEGEMAEVAAWLRLFCSEEYESRSLDPDVARLTRAAELLEQHQPAPVPVSDGEIMGLMPQQMRDDLAAAVRAMAEQEGIDSTPAKGVLRIILNRHVVDLARAVLARWGHQPAPPAEGEMAEVAAWLRLFCSEEYESRSLDPDVARLTRAAELLEQHQPAPVPVSELPQGWHMLSNIEPEPGARCDWVIMAPWGCDHGSGEWRDCDGVSPCNFFDVPVGWPVRYKGFASADGLMVSDPKLTAWRVLRPTHPRGH